MSIGLALAVVLAAPLSNDTYFVPQRWQQGGIMIDTRRSYSVRIPAVAFTPLPVVVHLHGAGNERWTEAIDEWTDTYPRHILVHPQGFQGRWNATEDESAAPDVEFLEAIIRRVVRSDNAQARVALVGTSNGGAMVHRMLLESHEPALRAGVACGAQVPRRAYRNGKFYAARDGFAAPVSPRPNRSVLTLAGGRDRIVTNEWYRPSGRCCTSPGGDVHTVATTAFAWARLAGALVARPLLPFFDDVYGVSYEAGDCAAGIHQAFVLAGNAHTCVGTAPFVALFLQRVFALA